MRIPRKLRLGLNRVLCLLLVSALPGVAIGASPTAAGAAGNSLLNTLRTLRAAVRSRVTSGYGSAELSVDRMKFGGKGRVHRRLHLNFWFSNNRCFWRIHDADAPHKLLGATLIRNGIVVQYFPGNGKIKNGVFGRASPNVQVNRLKAFQFRLLTLGYPISWTYRSLTRISPLDIDRHDWRFFPQARHWKPLLPNAPSPAVAIKKAGNLLTLRFKWPGNSKYGIIGITRAYAFDLSAGGMVSRWNLRIEQASGGIRIKESSSITTTWQRLDGQYFPSKRVITNRGRNLEPGGVWQSAGSFRTVIKFVKFKKALVNSSAFTIAHLHIPRGAVVFDNVHRSHYSYRPADADRLLGREGTPVGTRSHGGKQ